MTEFFLQILFFCRAAVFIVRREQCKARKRSAVLGEYHFHALFGKRFQWLADRGNEKVVFLSSKLTDTVEAYQLHILGDTVSLFFE